jgi:hypothetical protein
LSNAKDPRRSCRDHFGSSKHVSRSCRDSLRSSFDPCRRCKEPLKSSEEANRSCREFLRNSKKVCNAGGWRCNPFKNNGYRGIYRSRAAQPCFIN